MAFCYVVMCHTDPDGVLRLVRRIRDLSPHSRILVRYENPLFLDPAVVEAEGAQPLLSRTRVEWGAFSLVEAQLEAFAVARAMTGCEYVAVVSGQDYPVRDLARWEAEVRERDVDALLDPLVDQPDDHRWYWRVLLPPPALRPDRAPARRAVVKAGSLLTDRARVLVKPDEPRLWIGTRLRRHTPPVQPVKCGYWSVYGRRAIDSVLRADHTNPALRAFFGHVRTPDEWYVPSLVCADPELRVGLGATSGKHFPDGQPSPLWIDAAVLHLLRRRTEAPFVRKIPPDVDPAVLREADEMAGRTRAQVHAEVVDPSLRAAPWAGEIRATVVPPPALTTGDRR